MISSPNPILLLFTVCAFITKIRAAAEFSIDLRSIETWNYWHSNFSYPRIFGKKLIKSQLQPLFLWRPYFNCF